MYSNVSGKRNPGLLIILLDRYLYNSPTESTKYTNSCINSIFLAVLDNCISGIKILYRTHIDIVLYDESQSSLIYSKHSSDFFEDINEADCKRHIFFDSKETKDYGTVGKMSFAIVESVNIIKRWVEDYTGDLEALPVPLVLNFTSLGCVKNCNTSEMEKNAEILNTIKLPDGSPLFYNIIIDYDQTGKSDLIDNTNIINILNEVSSEIPRKHKREFNTHMEKGILINPKYPQEIIDCLIRVC